MTTTVLTAEIPAAAKAATAPVATARVRIPQNFTSAEEMLGRWLFDTGKLRELASLRAAHRQEQEERPWLKGPMVIQKFDIPCDLATLFGLCNRGLHWQGKSIGVEGICCEVLSYQKMDALIKMNT